MYWKLEEVTVPTSQEAEARGSHETESEVYLDTVARPFSKKINEKKGNNTWIESCRVSKTWHDRILLEGIWRIGLKNSDKFWYNKKPKKN
jgi:hypothetical protein